MKLTDAIASHITDVYNGENWTGVNFETTLADVTFEDAITVTKASVNTIAKLLYHTTFYNNVAVERINGNNPVINSDNGFDMPPVTTPEQWNKLLEDLGASVSRLANAVLAFPEERLWDMNPRNNGTFYQLFHGIAEHMHYHLGQVVLLKNLLHTESEETSRSGL